MQKKQAKNSRPLKEEEGQNALKLPGGEGIWVFVFGDLVVFSLFFSVFLSYRGDSLALFETSASTLNLTFGLVNTLVLLTSSWFMVCALKAFRMKDYSYVKRFSELSIICGLLFVLLKVFEYKEKISDGIGLTSNDFFMFYFVLTGIHLFHVVIGLIILTWLRLSLRHNNHSVSAPSVEASCIFWHMVDLLWIVLFPLLYLLP